MLSEALLDAEVRLGELFKIIPKASGGVPYHKSTPDIAVDSNIQKPKSKIIEDALFFIEV